MIPDRSAVAGRLLLSVVLLVYPIIVYFLLDELGPAVLGLFIIVLIAVRAGALIRRPGRVILLVSVLAGLFLLITFLGNGELALKFYPSLVSVFLLTAFAYTLWKPPSMIERIARTAGMKLSERAGPYTRIVTILWCFFFAANALLAALISMTGSMEAWAVYNGFIAYVAMALLLVGELIFRYFYKRRHGLIGGPQ